MLLGLRDTFIGQVNSIVACRKNIINIVISILIVFIIYNQYQDDDPFRLSVISFFAYHFFASIFELFNLKNNLWYNFYLKFLPGFDNLLCYTTKGRMVIKEKINNTYTLELLAWPYSGVQFYLKKQDGDLWELIAPKIVAESFIKDLEKYSGERIEVKEKREL